MKQLFIVALIAMMFIACVPAVVRDIPDEDYVLYKTSEPFPIILTSTTHLFVHQVIFKKYAVDDKDISFEFVFTHVYPADTIFNLLPRTASLYMTTADTTYSYAYDTWILTTGGNGKLERAWYRRIPYDDLLALAKAESVKVEIIGEGYALRAEGFIYGLLEYLSKMPRE